MPDIVVDNRASLIIADMVTAIAAATVVGVPVFDSVGTVNDVESFIRVADPVRIDGKVVCGIVEGTIEERYGNNSDEQGICRLPFEIIVRFLKRRKPGATETPAMIQAKNLLEVAKSAILIDKSRNGNADLVYWSGEVINGTTVRGTARPLTGKIPNEAFFTAALTGACAWLKYY